MFHSQEPLFAAVSVAMGVLTLLGSFSRAQAEALGLQVRDRYAGRSERLIAAILGLGLSGISELFLKGAVWLLLFMTMLSLVDRFVQAVRYDEPIEKAAGRQWRSGFLPAQGEPTAMEGSNDAERRSAWEGQGS
jgi:hypothetical protein